MTRQNMPVIDGDRLWSDLMSLGELTEPDRPYTRRSFSPMFDRGRGFLADRMREAGLCVRVDTAGNLIGRLEGSEPAGDTIMLGSHSDTVPAGGRFDGIAGVVAALEVVRVFVEQGRLPRHSLEVVDFLAEEPSPFGISCIGSRGMAGLLDGTAMALVDSSGRRLDEALRSVGGNPDLLSDARRDDVAAFFELHIEQGPVLEAAGVDIGVVTSIAGIRRIEIQFTGQTAHAGTAPMNLRHDAAVAAATTLLKVRRRAEKLSEEGYFVATVGIVEILPGGANVVPGEAKIVIDARSEDRSLTERFVELIDADSLAAAEDAAVRRTGFETLSDGLAALCDADLQRTITEATVALGLSSRPIASGAGHDAAFMARVCPTAMIFIPCLRGMSHTPDEWADKEALLAGASVLLRSVLRFSAT
ncbi:MAG: putative amidase [Bradyrhizobium sp.]|nr:putative amidase [Bradyrhizobium sp.]